MATQAEGQDLKKENFVKDVHLENKSIDKICVKGAREHNLKNIHLEIPRNKITVLTGLSGSGKSSVAFDIIYAEGQRRYIESLSAFARNFMTQLKKPDVDSVTGLSPSIAIDQKTTITNPRSTVGTVTEVYDYLRLLFAKLGRPLCPVHKVPVDSQTPQQIIDEIFKQPEGTAFYVLAPVVQDQKGEFSNEIRKWIQRGFLRARVDGDWVELADLGRLSKHKRHTIELLIDRLKVSEKFRNRLSESLHLALGLAKGQVKIEYSQSHQGYLYSIHRACPQCGYSFPDLESRMFSFNNPRGACEACDGLGYISQDSSGSGRPSSDDEESEDDDLYALQVCSSCLGTRLNERARSVLFDGEPISYYSELSIGELKKRMQTIELSGNEAVVAEKILDQIQQRLNYMVEVGTAYLSLSRSTKTLSGGEMQRIRLATQVGASMVGVLYVLDEPSIGLHPRDHQKLLQIFENLRDQGNTVLLVEHDEDTIWRSDCVIDLGPGAGEEGGQVMAQGTAQELSQNPQSLTGEYLSLKKKISLPTHRRKGNGKFLVLEGATGNNLKDVTLKIPQGTLCGVTGVSGSGKSTLIIDTLYRALSRHFYNSVITPAPYKNILGLESLDKVIDINQKPIGRTPRSTPATYVGLFPMIRDLYSQLPEAKLRGHRPGHFSFNVKGGRCEHCQGQGLVRVEMHFLSDVFITCEYCQGRRYSSEILNIRFKEKSIADVLEMSVAEAEVFFRNHNTIHRKLETLLKVGLGYIRLGQSSTTLSGGEAQRIKLSRELSKRGTGKTFYILDEPTTGLHFDDVKKLVELLQELVAQGNTVLVIEHNLDVIKSCDYLVDLGPEGGHGGGVIVTQGTPEEVVGVKESQTGQYLKSKLVP